MCTPAPSLFRNALRFFILDETAADGGGCDGTYPSAQDEVDDAARRRPAAAAAAEAVPARDVLFPSAAALPLHAGLIGFIDLRGEERARVRIMASKLNVW